MFQFASYGGLCTDNKTSSADGKSDNKSILKIAVDMATSRYDHKARFKYIIVTTNDIFRLIAMK